MATMVAARLCVQTERGGEGERERWKGGSMSVFVVHVCMLVARRFEPACPSPEIVIRT